MQEPDRVFAMDSVQHGPQPSQDIPSASNPQQLPLRVNPKYPLQSSLPASQKMPQPSLPTDANGNGVARTASRRRRISGSGQDRADKHAQQPVSKVPPISNHKLDSSGSPTSPTTKNMATFAARVRAAPGDLVSLRNEFDPAPQSMRPSRRGSINRPPGAVYSEIRGTERKSFPSPRVDSNSAQYLLNTTTPRQNREIEPTSPQETSNDAHSPQSAGNSSSHPQSRSQARRASTGVTGSKTEWAPDRSPLQELEVRLNDISKEEKRARVERAEQELRESQMSGKSRQPDGDIDPSSNRRQSRGVSAGSTSRPKSQAYHQLPESKKRGSSREIEAEMSSAGRHESEPTKATSPFDRQQHSSRYDKSPEQITVRDPATSSNSRRSVSSPEAGQLPEKGVRFKNGSNLRDPNQFAINQTGKPFTDSEPRPVRNSSARVSSIPVEGGVRAPKVRVRQESAHVETKSPKTPDASKVHSSRLGDTTLSDQALPEPVRSTRKDPTYEQNAPATSATRTRRAAPRNDDPNAITSSSTQRRHHLSDLLHHHRESESVADHRSEPKSRRLDEWRQSGVARLTLADFNPPTNESANRTPWWEKGSSNGIGNSSKVKSSHSRGTRSVDGSYDEGLGKNRFPVSLQDKGLGDTPDNLSSERGHVRPYVGDDGDVAAACESRSDFSSQLSLLRFRSRKNPHLCLSTAYSYSCPQLAEHDISHFHHICKPYVSKELTQSMRSIRIRAVPSPASFNPPLYLKCGPLLRYTGLKRDRLENSRDSRNDGTTVRETWRGSVMIVTNDAESSYNPAPILQLFPEPIDLLPPPPQNVDESGQSLPSEYIDPVAGLPKLSRTGKTVYVKPVEDLEQEVDLSRVEDDSGLFEETRTAAVPTSYGQPSNRPRRDVASSPANSKRHRGRENWTGYQQVKGVRLHAERGVTFWRFSLEVELGDHQARIAYRINGSASVGFWVPARGQSMNIMFHSCNGFSMSVKPATFSGPDPLWRDVLNSHQTRPFHVMIGGGDQIYNDAVMSQTTLFHEWLEIKNPHHKHQAEFSSEMHEELEVFYLERYSMWFSQGLFGMANSQIPMINIWDDHDIIDGFGSYPDHLMSTPVFRGVGAVAFKYYMLFQHQSIPDELTADEPSWLLGASPGPYIKELSRSVFMSLGKHVAFLGLDCRTERRRDEVLSEESYELVFDRCRREIVADETKHLVVLLGVPIAYPRLVWLENLLTSRVMDPIKALSKIGMLGGFLNKFDGGVEILDDLDDHWTAKNHKHERNWFIQELQDLAAQKSVRITILGGDVHLAAIGQFYSNPKLGIPKDQDHRYMANIISSAIVNTPPPEMMGDILNKRNKVHHLDSETDESMIPMFTHDVDGKPRNNKHLLPRRNWCSIREYYPGTTPPPTPPLSGRSTPSDESIRPPNRLQRTLSLTRHDVKPGNLIRRLSGRGPRTSMEYPPSNEYPSSPAADESSPPRLPMKDGYFTSHHSSSGPASKANGSFRSPVRHSSAPLPRPGNFHRRPTNMSEKAVSKGGNDRNDGHINLEHGLDIVINCEVSQKDPAGITVPYRLLIPALWYEGEGDPNDISYRKQSWIKRLGSISVKKRRGSVLAKRQGQGNWGRSFSEESQTESEGEEDSGYENHDFQPTRGGTVRGNRDDKNGVRQHHHHHDLARDAGDEMQGFQDVQWESRGTRNDHHDSPPEQGDTRRYAPQERRASKVDDMLGMAGPAENGNVANGSGGINGGAKRLLSRFENDSSPRTDLGRSQSTRGYGGIEAYRESRWRGLLRRKD